MVADKYQQGRVFLAGDAAHLNWPAGGFGMNTGVGDAVDIGWKLAAMLQGWGGANLLNSYTAERKPIAMINVNEAAEMRANFDNQTPFSPKIGEDSDEGRALRDKARAAIMRTRAKEFQHDSAGIELGYRYENSPICVADGTPAPELDHGLYVPSTWPGARAPHVWLKDGRSTLDLFGKGFVLLNFSGTKTNTFTDSAKQVGLPLEVVNIDEPKVREIYERDLVLVRPDGHVAWRGNDSARKPERDHRPNSRHQVKLEQSTWSPHEPKTENNFCSSSAAIRSLFISPAAAATKVSFPYTPIGVASWPWWIAKDAGYFEKHGLEVDMIYVGASPVIVQAMLGGQAGVGAGGGTPLVTNVLQGGDVVQVATMVPYAIQSLIVRPISKRPRNLPAKRSASAVWARSRISPCRRSPSSTTSKASTSSKPAPPPKAWRVYPKARSTA